MESNLAQVSVSQDELKHYVSLTAVQTKGLKRYLKESEISEANIEQQGCEDDQNQVVINTIKGAKKRRLALVQGAEEEKVSTDLNVLGLEVSSNLYNGLNLRKK